MFIKDDVCVQVTYSQIMMLAARSYILGKGSTADLHSVNVAVGTASFTLKNRNGEIMTTRRIDLNDSKPLALKIGWAIDRLIDSCVWRNREGVVK